MEAVFDSFDPFTRELNEKIRYLEDFDMMCQMFSVLELTEFKDAIEQVSQDVEAQKKIFKTNLGRLKENEANEKAASIQAATITAKKNEENNVGSSKTWSFDDCQLLTKAVNLFPAGTKDRWEVVTTYIEQHSACKGIKRKARDVLSKAKELQKLDPLMKQETNNNAFNKLQVIATPSTESEPSERYDNEINSKHTAAAARNDMKAKSPPKDSSTTATSSPSAAWTDEEQKLLEQAIKTYPASTEARWDRIAECISTRSKKEVLQRYKDLAELARARKAALQAAAARK